MQHVLDYLTLHQRSLFLPVKVIHVYGLDLTRYDSFQASTYFIYPFSFRHDTNNGTQVEDALPAWLLSEGKVEHSHS